MPLNIPSPQQQIEQVIADITAQLPDLDPTVRGSVIRALAISVANREYATALLLQQVADQAFPQTATGVNLELFAAIEDLSRNPDSGAIGNVVFRGTSGSVVPAGSKLLSATGQTYTLQGIVTMAEQIATITSLSQSGGVATAIAAGHGLATGMTVTVSGANDSEYNGSFQVTVVDDSTFTYTVDASANSPTAGTISAVYTGAIGTVESDDGGVATNLGSGSRLTLSTARTGVNSVGLVRVDGLTGGADQEDDDALRIRILESRRSFRANFSPNTIIKEAKKIPGVTRVKVLRATPDPGDVTVHFVRDNDSNIIPSALDVAAVRAALLEFLPAATEEDSLIVSAPTAVTVDFTFTSLSPNTEAMQTAVTASLEAMFRDDVEIGANLTEITYESAIADTVADSDRVESSALSSPSGDVAITDSQIAVLGTVTFP